ncbi:MAG TPA: hypothetical protein PKX06_13475 [Phenylobacterium sp.]|nr:hypothetical protein [Phenylobacterium sp.]
MDEFIETFDEGVEVQEFMSLRIQVHSPGTGAEELALAAEAGRQRDYDEFVILAGAEYPPCGMDDIRNFVADRVAGRPNAHEAIGKVLGHLRSGKLSAGTVKGQEKRWIELARWMARDAGEIVRTGLLDGADVYIVVDPVAAGLGEPPGRRMEWDPVYADTLQAWCFRPEVLREANGRVLIERGKTLSGRVIFRAMEAMWKEARQRGCSNPSIAGSWQTIEQAFAKSGTNVLALIPAS